jgi:hypothetical protein
MFTTAGKTFATARTAGSEAGSFWARIFDAVRRRMVAIIEVGTAFRAVRLFPASAAVRAKSRTLRKSVPTWKMSAAVISGLQVTEQVRHCQLAAFMDA